MHPQMFSMGFRSGEHAGPKKQSYWGLIEALLMQLNSPATFKDRKPFCLCHQEVMAMWMPDRKQHKSHIFAQILPFKGYNVNILISWWTASFGLITVFSKLPALFFVSCSCFFFLHFEAVLVTIHQYKILVSFHLVLSFCSGVYHHHYTSVV